MDTIPKIDPATVLLTAKEREAARPSLKRLSELQREYQIVLSTIRPFIEMIAKRHSVDTDKYSLAPDGSAFVLNKGCV